MHSTQLNKNHTKHYYQGHDSSHPFGWACPRARRRGASCRELLGCRCFCEVLRQQRDASSAVQSGSASDRAAPGFHDFISAVCECREVDGVCSEGIGLHQIPEHLHSWLHMWRVCRRHEPCSEVRCKSAGTCAAHSLCFSRSPPSITQHRGIGPSPGKSPCWSCSCAAVPTFC